MGRNCMETGVFGNKVDISEKEGRGTFLERAGQCFYARNMF